MFWTELRWRTIVGEGWSSLISRVVDGLPTTDIHVSIDKDCLTPEHAITNWGNGRLTLEQLVEAVRTLKKRKRMVGADITGEYSPIEVENRLMRAMALKIHPKMPEPSPEDLRRNEETNLALVDALGL